ncbi:MAG: hypothetical protein P8P99_03470 [Maricaulis sp.]|jgi:hypothetical protein|nr:hypothetical protein [Maricaulis sp.]
MRTLIPMMMTATLALSSCATSTPTTYSPSYGDGHGYSDQRIEQDRFRTRFDAGSDMSMQQARDMALVQAAELTLEEGGDWFIVAAAAELTLEEGGDWFIVAAEDVSGNDRNPVQVGASVGRSFGSGGRSGSSVGLWSRIDGNAGEKTVSLEILIRSGDRELGPNSYDARDVIRNNPACGCDALLEETD